MERSDSFGSRNEDGWNGRDDNYRRRSPPPSDRQGTRFNRNRSRSPRQIDRYQPGRRDDFHNSARRDEGHRRRSPPPVPQGNIDRYVPGQEPAIPVVNPLPNPLSLDYQVGFNWFAEWWRKDQEVKEERERQKTGVRRAPPRVKGEQESKEDREKERSQIQAAYDTYKEKLQIQQARTFVAIHRGEEWFKERYDPNVRDPFRRRMAEHRRDIYNQWQQDLENGLFDSFTLEGIYKSESNGAGGIVEKEEGETTAAAEIQGVGDLLPCKGGDLRDDAAQQPALLIKTIAPHVSREKMEEFCKEHLGESEGGFHWLSLSDPNPQKKCHRIGWVMLNAGGEPTAIVKDERGDGRDADGEDGFEEGEDAMDTSGTDNVTQTTADKALAEINGKSIVDEERGNFQCHVGVHVPPTSPRKKALWDLFSAPERIERDLHLTTRIASKLEQELGEDVTGVNKIEERVEELRSQGQLEPPSNQQLGSNKPPKDTGDVDAEDGEEGEMEEDEEGLYDEETDDEDLLAKKKKLDLTVEYLRRVFSFCVFCVFESDSVHELSRKCPGGHLRRPRASLTSSAKSVAKASAFNEEFPLKKQEPSANLDEDENESPTAERPQRFNKNNKSHHQLQRAFNWVKTYEDKLFQILEPENADINKLGGRPVEDALEEELKKYVKQEDEAKFRCKVPECTKLFKGESFWRKHVEKRHNEWYEGLKKDLDLINAYVLDPAHITPSRSDANSNGHFPSNNGMPTGTPRGFNLSAMTPFGFPPNMASGMPNAGGLPNFGQYPVNMPGFGVAMDGNGQVGPMRRGGGRMNSRSGNPYERQGKDARNQRWGNNGRLTPPRGGRMNMMGGGPRFPDAQPAAVGPKEAVAGRSLKSYEDLDAVDTGGDGALDY